MEGFSQLPNQAKRRSSSAASSQAHDVSEGERFQYNNTGYVLLAMMIEAAAGGDFAYFQGCDPGVSFLAEYNPDRDMICVLVSNYGDDVWKEMRKIRTELYPGTE